MLNTLRSIYRGKAERVQIVASRYLGRIIITKSESVMLFNARFNDKVRTYRSAGGRKSEAKLVNLCLCAVTKRFPWWVTAMRALNHD